MAGAARLQKGVTSGEGVLPDMPGSVSEPSDEAPKLQPTSSSLLLAALSEGTDQLLQRVQHDIIDHPEHYPEKVEAEEDPEPMSRQGTGGSDASVVHAPSTMGVRSQLASQYIKDSEPSPEPRQADQMRCPFAVMHFLICTLLFLVGVSPRPQPALAQKVVLAIIVIAAGVKAILCVTKLARHDGHGFSFFMCCATASQAITFVGVLLDLHCKGLPSLIKRLRAEAQAKDFMLQLAFSQLPDFAVVAMYFLLYYTGAVMQLQQASLCPPKHDRSMTCIECFGGILTMGLGFCLLLLNRFVEQYVHHFARKCWRSPGNVKTLAKDWARITTFTSLISRAISKGHMFMMAFALLDCVPGTMQILLGTRTSSSRERCASHWVIPSLAMALANLMFSLHVWRAAASATEACHRIQSLVHQVQTVASSLPLHQQHILPMYVQQSDAGIFVSGMKVTGPLLLKILSLIATATVAVLTQIAAMSQEQHRDLHILLSEALAAMASNSTLRAP